MTHLVQTLGWNLWRILLTDSCVTAFNPLRRNHLQGVLKRVVQENKQMLDGHIAHEMILTMYFTSYELLIRQWQGTQAIASQYLIKDSAFLFWWGKICLHYYCTGASLFVWAGFHHTYSKWQKGKLILLYLYWIIDGILSPSTAVSFLPPPDCHALLSFPVSSWGDSAPFLGEYFHNMGFLWEIGYMKSDLPQWSAVGLYKKHWDSDSGEWNDGSWRFPVQLLQAIMGIFSRSTEKLLLNGTELNKGELAHPTNKARHYGCVLGGTIIAWRKSWFHWFTMIYYVMEAILYICNISPLQIKHAWQL